MSVELIAECGTNHMASKSRALELIAAAAEAGAQTVKWQLWTADELWRSDDPRHEEVKSLALPEAWLPDLKAECEKRGVEFLCTPFSPRAVKVLTNLGVKRLKIASGDVTYLPLLEAVHAEGLPVLMSVGFATWEEIRNALGILMPKTMSVDTTLLWCVGSYPTPPKDAHISIVRWLDEHNAWWYSIGLSSHWREWWIDIAVIPMGIVCIEKHFDLEDRAGPESGHSLTPSEFAQFARAVRDVEAALAPYPDKFTQADEYAREHSRRDPLDWLRPVR